MKFSPGFMLKTQNELMTSAIAEVTGFFCKYNESMIE